MRPRARVAENLSQYPVAPQREDIAVPARPSPNNSRTETRTERVSGNPSSLILLSFSCAPRSLSHCPNDFHIAGATADIPGHEIADLYFRRVGIPLQQRLGHEDHTRRAVTALKSALVEEGPLQRVEFAVRSDPFNRGDPFFFRVRGKEQAGTHRLAVEEHRASAANPFAAAVFGSRPGHPVAPDT